MKADQRWEVEAVFGSSWKFILLSVLLASSPPNTLRMYLPDADYKLRAKEAQHLSHSLNWEDSITERFSKGQYNACKNIQCLQKHNQFPNKNMLLFDSCISLFHITMLWSHFTFFLFIIKICLKFLP